MPHTLKWFTSRIGKRIYRDKSSCQCDTCRDVEKNGIIIRDLQHANYLHLIEHEFGHEGIFLNYRDTK